MLIGRRTVAYSFTPPTYTLKNVNAGPLLSRFTTTFAYSVVKTGSTYESVTHPALEVFSTADFVYQGGHQYTITDAEAALLIAAGYAVTVHGYTDIYTDLMEG